MAAPLVWLTQEIGGDRRALGGGSVARRKLGMSWEQIGDALAAIRVLCPSPMPLTLDMHDAGVRIANKYGFQFYDAQIAAAALEAECTTLYSEDFQDGQIIEGRLTVRNPFVSDARSTSNTKSQNGAASP